MTFFYPSKTIFIVWVYKNVSLKICCKLKFVTSISAFELFAAICLQNTEILIKDFRVFRGCRLSLDVHTQSSKSKFACLYMYIEVVKVTSRSSIFKLPVDPASFLLTLKHRLKVIWLDSKSQIQIVSH